MSLRLRRAEPGSAEEPSVWEEAKPWVEKLLLSPQGIGMIAIGVGILLRMTHLADIPFQGPTTPEHRLPPPLHRYGLDQVIWSVKLDVATDWVSAITAASQSLGNPLAFFSQVLANHLVSFATQSVSPQGHLKVDILLSDVLILMGIAAFVGGSVQGLLSAIPKV